ncbi:MAG: hypothetical protein K0U84_20295 [Actinomycetia bacterium]|nr:hypothetical protein [Actinomycetes bacterium]
MLTGSLRRSSEAIFVRLAGGNRIRADELRTRATASFLAFVMISYIPLMAMVVLGWMQRPAAGDDVAERDQITAVGAYATRYVDTYLKDPSNSAAIEQFYDGDVPMSALPAGGHALRASSALPGAFIDGYRTYSVVVDAEIPQAANSASMAFVRLQVDISADRKNLFRAFTLPHARPDRPAGLPVQLATQTLVSEDRPVFRVVSGFLSALLTGQGDLTPFITAGSDLTPAHPPQFATMAIERVQTNSELATAQDVPPKADGIEVTVRAVMQTASGVLMPMDFPLVMSVAGGHWQVDRINDAPAVIAPDESGAQQSSTSPTTSASRPTYFPNAPKGS